MNKIRDIEFKHSSFITLHLQLHNQLLRLIQLGNWPHGSYNPHKSQLALQQAEPKILDSDLAAFKRCCYSREPHLLVFSDIGSSISTDDDHVVFSGWLREVQITPTQLSSRLYRHTGVFREEVMRIE